MEKSHQTPEEKKKQQELLKKLKYDPKTKTIEVDGHRTRFNIDRENFDTAYMTSDYVNKKKRDKLNKYRSSSKSNQHKYSKSEKKEIENISNKLKASHSSGVGKMKIGGVTVSKDMLDEDTILHEIGHIRDYSNRRRANAQPSYVSKYGTSELPKDARKARLELNKLNKKGKLTPVDSIRKKKLEKIVDKSIKSTASYKNDKELQRKDAIDKMDKEVNKAIRKKSRKLNSHDKIVDEYYADAYALKHGTGNVVNKIIDHYIKINKRLKNVTKEEKIEVKKELKNMLKKELKSLNTMDKKQIDKLMDTCIGKVLVNIRYNSEVKVMKQDLKSSKNRKKIGEKAYKRNMEAIESVIDELDDSFFCLV